MRWLLLLLAAPLLCAGPLAAQEPGRRQPGRYELIPIDGDLDLNRILREQMQRTRDLEDLLQIFKDIDLPLSSLPKLDPDRADGALKEQVQEWLNKQAPENLPDVAKLQEIQERLKQMAANAGGAMSPPPIGTEGQPPSTPAGAVRGPSAEQRERMTRWLRDFMRQIDRSEIGDVLRESPGWQRALGDLARSLENRAGGGGWPTLNDLTNLRLPDNIDMPLLSGAWDRLRGLSLPQVRIRLPRLGMGGLGSPRGFGTSAFSFSALGLTLLWVLLTGLVLLLVWQMLARRQAARGWGNAGWRPGPWPVDPARVATREELIRAFEHLSLLLLGREAGAWNHRVIADRLTELNTLPLTDRVSAVVSLAALYEQARYAPVAEPLAADQLAAARRDLCVLAGRGTV